MRRLTEGSVTMTEYIRVKIKDRDRFKQVFPLPVEGVDDDSDLANFILSILGRTIRVSKMRSQTGSFYYVSDIDPRWVIIPNWIQYFDTEDLVLSDSHEQPLVLEDGTVVVTGL